MDEDILRRRRADLRDELDRIPERQGGSESFLAKVFDAGHLPSGAMKYYACRPVEVAGAEAEGTLATFTVGGAEIEVAVLNGSPAVGDILVARRTGNRWVAELPGNPYATSNCGCGPGTPMTLTLTGPDGFGGTTARVYTYTAAPAATIFGATAFTFNGGHLPEGWYSADPSTHGGFGSQLNGPGFISCNDVPCNTGGYDLYTASKVGARFSTDFQCADIAARFLPSSGAYPSNTCTPLFLRGDNGAPSPQIYTMTE